MAKARLIRKVLQQKRQRFCVHKKQKLFVVPTTLLLIIILSSLAFAYNPSLDSDQFAYEQPHHNPFNTGAMIGVSPLPVSFDIENITVTDSISFGSELAPTVCDLDDDGYNEIIIVDGVILYVYSGTDDSFDLLDSYVIGTGTSFQPYCGELIDHEAGNEIFIVSGLTAAVLNYDTASGITLSTSSLLSNTAESEYNCIENVSGYPSACYFGNDNNELVEILPYADSSDVTYTTATSCNELYSATTDNGYRRTAPIIADFDGDSKLEVVMHCGNSATNNQYFYAYEYNVTNFSINSAKDSDMFTSGEVNWAGNAPGVSNFMGYNLDSSGDVETCVTFTAGATSYLRCYNSDGTQYDSYSLSTGATTNFGEMVYADYDNDGDDELIVGHGTSGTNFVVRVLDATVSNTITPEVSIDLGITITNADYFNLDGVGLDVTNDNAIDLIVGGRVLESNGSNPYLHEDVFLNNSVCSFGLINDDNYVDVICSKGSNTELYLGSFGIAPSTSGITLNPYLADSGFYNYYPTVCVGSTVTFRADECIGDFDITACRESKTYVNPDTSDQERLIAGGCTGGTQTGSYSNYLPEVECDLNLTGTTSITLYLQDDDNPTDYSVSETIAINVIDGTEGVDCNSPTSFIGSPDGQPVATTTYSEDTAVQDMFNDIAGNSSQLKSVIGLFIMISVGIALFIQTKSGIFASTGAILTGFVCLVFGLFSMSQVITVAGVSGVILLIIYIASNRGV